MKLATLSLAAGLLVLGASADAFAQQGKFAYVDMQQALTEIEEAKVAKARLKRQFEDKQKMLDEKQDDLKRENDTLEKQAMAMNEQKRMEKMGELQRKAAEVAQLWQKLQKELSEEERKLTQEIFLKMGGIIRQIAEAEQFTMVFEKSDSGLLYAPESMNITNELVRKYNAKFPVKGAAEKPEKKAEKSK
ncbi:MAG: OmpH family outer membrane protein [Myxococcales bacterium]